MAFPDTFFFSAHKLQAYADCARRFELQYREELQWPAVPQEPLLAYEQHMENGRLFHEMVERDLNGIPANATAYASIEDIARWWTHYENARPGDQAGDRFPERTLVGTLAGKPLVATYDLIVHQPDGMWTIFDWKTARKRPTRDVLSRRLQSRVYPFVLAQRAGSLIGGGVVDPESIQMTYWFADFPDDPEAFAYNKAQFEEDQDLLAAYAARMLADEATFPLTDEARLCGFCQYRSYCGRGAAAAVVAPDEFEDNDGAFDGFMGDLADMDAIAF